MKKLLFVTLLVLSKCAFSFEQGSINARIDAMSGVYVSDDVGWSIIGPYRIALFPDQLQCNMYTSHMIKYGTYSLDLIAIKSLGERFLFGITLDYRSLMPRHFFNVGSNLLRITSDSEIGKFNYIPKFALAFVLNEKVILGGSAIFERRTKNKNTKKTFPYNSSTNEIIEVEHTTIEKEKKVGYTGFNLDALIKGSNFFFQPSLHYIIPYFGGSEEDNLLSALEQRLPVDNAADTINVSNYSILWDMNKGWKFGGALLFSFFTNSIEYNIGLWYSNTEYQLTSTQKTVNVTLDEEGKRVPGWYISNRKGISNYQSAVLSLHLGIVPNIRKHFSLPISYYGSLSKVHTVHAFAIHHSSIGSLLQSLHIGAEYTKNDIWIFDQLYVRCGIAGYVNKEWRDVENDPMPNKTENIPWADYFWGPDFGNKKLKISSGLGSTLKRVTVDCSLDLFEWKTGSQMQEHAFIISVTYNFGKKVN